MEHGVCGHAQRPGLAGPDFQNAETELPFDIEAWVDAVAAVLDEVDLGGNEGVAWRDFELQLDKFMAVDGILRAD